MGDLHNKFLNVSLIIILLASLAVGCISQNRPISYGLNTELFPGYTVEFEANEKKRISAIIAHIPDMLESKRMQDQNWEIINAKGSRFLVSKRSFAPQRDNVIVVPNFSVTKEDFSSLLFASCFEFKNSYQKTKEIRAGQQYYITNIRLKMVIQLNSDGEEAILSPITNVNYYISNALLF